MGKFIKTFVLFTIILLLIASLLDLLISRNLQKSGTFAKGEVSVWNDIYKGKVVAEVAIYGSSRAWVHIDPEIIEDSLGKGAYNFGLDGHNFWLQYLRHRKYLKYNKDPKYIIYSLDAMTFAKRKDLFQYEQFLPFMLFDKEIEQYTSSYVGFDFSDFFIPLIRYYGQGSALREAINIIFFSNQAAPERNKGFRGRRKKWKSDQKIAKENYDKIAMQIHEPSIELFKDFLVECKTNNIDVILVYTPMHVEGQNVIVNHEEILNYYRSIADENDIIFLDYSGDSMNNNKIYFYNSMHLNARGANRFTKMLTQDLHKIIAKE